ncbi:MAG: hypothetical protein IJ618_10630 [Prevotella sp.]|nr:hypothetical protein [Prevotella sp.]
MKHPAIPEESCNFVAVNSNNKFAEWTNIYPMSIEPRAEMPSDMKRIIILEKYDMVQGSLHSKVADPSAW